MKNFLNLAAAASSCAAARAPVIIVHGSARRRDAPREEIGVPASGETSRARFFALVAACDFPRGFFGAGVHAVLEFWEWSARDWCVHG